MNVLRYRHSQFGAVVVGSLAASALVLAGLGLAFGDPIFLYGGPVMMGIAALLFYHLTVEIDATHLRFRFGIGLIRQRIPLAEIVEAKPVRNTWLYGWGIHRTPHGWLYNVSGREAVEITLTSGERLRRSVLVPMRQTIALRFAYERLGRHGFVRFCRAAARGDFRQFLIRLQRPRVAGLIVAALALALAAWRERRGCRHGPLCAWCRRSAR